MATITFGSNTTTVGTSAGDALFGNEAKGNTNDIVYGNQGDDTIASANGISNSVMYGGQGNDLIFANSPVGPTQTVTNDVIYGNFGNDTIIVTGAETIIGAAFSSNVAAYGGQGNDIIEDTFTIADYLNGNLGDDGIYMFEDFGTRAYGGGGNDDLLAEGSTGMAIYGNLGNDTIDSFETNNSTLYGGQNEDIVYLEEADAPGNDRVYGNLGNDLLMGGFDSDIYGSSLWGGQGDDTLVLNFGDIVNDSMNGGLGSDLFVTSNDAFGNPIRAPFEFDPTDPTNQIVTVEDFLHGTDHLSMSTLDPLALVKEDDAPANGTEALADANGLFTADPTSHYVFIYGGTGAGYLFYNGDGGGTAATAGMALLGDNGQHSVELTDIVKSTFA